MHALNIDITLLDLSCNELTTLPENVFAGLTNLQMLFITFNPWLPHQTLHLPVGVKVYGIPMA